MVYLASCRKFEERNTWESPLGTWLSHFHVRWICLTRVVVWEFPTWFYNILLCNLCNKELFSSSLGSCSHCWNPWHYDWPWLAMTSRLHRWGLAQWPRHCTPGISQLHIRGPTIHYNWRQNWCVFAWLMDTPRITWLFFAMINRENEVCQRSNSGVAIFGQTQTCYSNPCRHVVSDESSRKPS